MDIDKSIDFGKSEEALNRTLIRKADVALIDFALEPDGLNGVELGIALRNINEYIGIVIYSQFSVPQMVKRVPAAMRSGWSFFEKSAHMDLEDYVDILKRTSIGKGNWEDVLKEDSSVTENESSLFFSLNPRQRTIMTLTSQGLSAHEVATQLDLSYAHIRRELSRAYAILVPDSDDSINLRTSAIIKYLEFMKLSS
jgi:DNA-binding NarL/FixJ family response regulator